MNSATASNAARLDLGFVRRAGRTVIDRRMFAWPFVLTRSFHVDPDRPDCLSVIVQTASGVEVARESASLAYVAGAGGGPITVRAMASPERELARLQEPRVYAFDPAWLGEQGDSGYDVAWPMYRPLKIILR